MRDLIVPILLLLVPTTAPAATITIFFEGSIGGPLSSFQPGPLGSVMRFGDPVYGTLTYDTSVPDTDPRPERGEYAMTRPDLGFDFYLGGAHVVSDPTSTAVGVQILNGFDVVRRPVDRFGFGSGYIQVTPAPPIVPQLPALPHGLDPYRLRRRLLADRDPFALRVRSADSWGHLRARAADDRQRTVPEHLRELRSDAVGVDPGAVYRAAGRPRAHGDRAANASTADPPARVCLRTFPESPCPPSPASPPSRAGSRWIPRSPRLLGTRCATCEHGLLPEGDDLLPQPGLRRDRVRRDRALAARAPLVVHQQLLPAARALRLAGLRSCPTPSPRSSSRRRRWSCSARSRAPASSSSRPGMQMELVLGTLYEDADAEYLDVEVAAPVGRR